MSTEVVAGPKRARLAERRAWRGAVLLVWLLCPAAVADYGRADSAEFSVNLLDVPIGILPGHADSEVFGVDATGVQRGSSDSGLFFADTNLDEIALYTWQSYSAEAQRVSLWAAAWDVRRGWLQEGSITWSLRDSSWREVAGGELHDSGEPGIWCTDTSVGPLSPGGTYTILYSLVTRGAQPASTLAALVMTGATATVTGQVQDSTTGTALSGAEVALFDAARLWSYVNSQHGGVVPPLATLVTGIGAARGPVTTGADGRFSWTDVAPGGSYVAVAAKAGYHQAYTAAFAVTAGGETVTRNLALSPASAATLLALTADVLRVRDGAEAILNRNARLVGKVTEQWYRDDIYTFHIDWFSLAASMIGAGGGGIHSIAEGAIRTTAEQFMTVAGKVLAGLARSSTLLSMEYLQSLLLENGFPADEAGYLASELHQAFLRAMNEAVQGFQGAAGSTPLAPGFSVVRARDLADQILDHTSLVVQAENAYVAGPEPGQGIYGFALADITGRYMQLSALHRGLQITKNVLSGVQIAGGVVMIGSAATGTGAPVAAVAATATKAAGWAKEAVTLADISVKHDMAVTFATAVCGTYPLENERAVRVLADYVSFLTREAGDPFYLHQMNRFRGSLAVDMNFPLGVPYLWALGLPLFDTASGTATVTVTDQSSIGAGSGTLEARLIGWGTWSPMTLGSLFGKDPGALVTCSEVRGPVTLSPGGSRQFSVPYRGYSRNFLSQFKPHYLQIQAFIGPWLVASKYEVFYVLSPGAILTPVSMTAGGPATSGIRSSDVFAAAVTREGPVPMSRLQELARGTTLLGEFLLSSDTPARSAVLDVTEEMYAVDLRVFAPVDAGIAVLVTDAQGKRLGYSTRDGVLYKEMPGAVTNMGQRPVAVQLLRPTVGGHYTVEVALLTPGPTEVAVSVFAEPVWPSSAMMMSFPAALLLDGTRGSTQSATLRLGEVSGQGALGEVAAEFRPLLHSTDASAQLAATSPVQVLGAVGAGEQRLVEWEVPFPEYARGGKYLGRVVCSSGQTAELEIPVVALVRNTLENVNLFETSAEAPGKMQVELTTGQTGTAETWVTIPGSVRVVHAIVGVAPGSPDVENPSLDIGADGSAEWQYVGRLEFGLNIDNLEAAFNAFVAGHGSEPGPVQVPIRIAANPGRTLVLGGLQLFLDAGRPGDLDDDGDADLNDFARFQVCFNGASRPPAQAVCEGADFDRDGDVDLNDFATFQLCFNGASRPPACQ